MVTNDMLKKHEKRCDEILEEMSQYLILGKCSDYAEYKQLTGKIRGMNMAREVLEDSIHQLDEDKEDDEI